MQQNEFSADHCDWMFLTNTFTICYLDLTTVQKLGVISKTVGDDQKQFSERGFCVKIQNRYKTGKN